GSDLLELINDILDLSKVEAGKMDVNPAAVGLDDVRQYAEQAFTPVAEQKELTFATEVAPDMPASVFTDEQRLQQVLRNLLSNAFKFTERGEVRLRIGPAPEGTRFVHDALEQADQVFAFHVSDTGIGVPDDKLRLIFEAFQQADGTTARRFGGTGLGLSISREIARLLGGEIHAESTVGEGSTFTLYLPASYHAEHSPTGLATTVVEGRPLVAHEAAEGRVVTLPDNELGDDRGTIAPGDRVVLVV